MKKVVPFRIKYGETNRLLWVDTSALDLSEPFFDENIVKNLSRIGSGFVETDLTELFSIALNGNEIRPNGFIFHMSRCGSTLLANLFRKVQGTTALSEPAIVTEILNLDNEETHSFVVDLFRNTVLSLGQRRDSRDRFFVVKLPCDATMAIPLIREAFPDVPHLFIYRDPVEVLVSALKHPTQDIFYNERLLQRPLNELVEFNTLSKNAALALNAICDHFLRHFNPKSCMVLNYADLNGKKEMRKMMTALTSFLSMDVTEQALDEMCNELGIYSKDRSLAFKNDSIEKRAMASANITQMVELHMMETYNKLERLRPNLG